VKQEQNIIQDSVGFSSDLRELVSDVKESKVQCQQVAEKVQSLAENTQRENGRLLQARETQINGTYNQKFSIRFFPQHNLVLSTC
jgi:hypothetical protein